MATEPEIGGSDDLARLIQQVHGGIVMLEEMLDRREGGDWVTPRRGRSESSAARYAWGQLSTAWINLCTLLLEDPAIEPWMIAPLEARSSKGEQSSWEWGPDRSLVIEHLDAAKAGLEFDRIPRDAVRLVDQPREPRYTLEEAKALLEVCQNHAWSVETTDAGAPLGVRCDNCGDRRPLR